jgi:hypothetical protein
MKAMRFSHIIPGAVVLLSVLVSPGCSKPVDLQKTLEVTDITTGWFDAGIVPDPEGPKNKLVPTISFRLKNVGDRKIQSVQVYAVFKVLAQAAAGEEQVLGEIWVPGIRSEGLPAGEATEPLTLRADNGYKSPQPRAEMLQNKLFVDAGVTVFAKHRSQQYVALAEHRIARQLLTR